MGKLIVIDGLDGCGKQTQTQALSAILGYRRITFPTYTKSSALIEMYLGGEFGEADAVNVYAASTFYAVDRYSSFMKDWGQDYKNGETLIFDRYTTANIIHQMSKLSPDKWDGYISWLEELEYEKIGLPKPDIVVFLDLPLEISAKLMAARKSKIEGDIHEGDLQYLKRCRTAAGYAADKLGWKMIDCTRDGEILPIEDITNIITTVLKGACL